MTFREALTIAYGENPCQVSATALWKVLRDEGQCQTHFESLGYNVRHLEMWHGRRLLQHWDRDRADPHLDMARVEVARSATIHQDYARFFPPARFPHRKPYYHLFHRGSQRVAPARLPSGFHFEDVDLHFEAPLVAEVIARCYDGVPPTEEAVKTWVDHPVYDPHLWVWMVDEKENRPVALGIAEHDRLPRQATLDWVQVIPEYRRRGLGKAVVLELLARIGRHVGFVTVAGEQGNLWQPEGFYRSCGFEGDDVWWMVSTHG